MTARKKKPSPSEPKGRTDNEFLASLELSLAMPLQAMSAADDTARQFTGDLERSINPLRFNWSSPEAKKASKLRQLDHINSARDIAAGVASLLAALEQQELDDGCLDDHERPIQKVFTVREHGDLQRLAISSLRLLSDVLDQSIKLANDDAEARATP